MVVYLTGAQLGALTRIGAGSISSAVRQVIDDSGIVLSPATPRPGAAATSGDSNPPP